MEPRSRERGNLALENVQPGDVALQWSRAQESAEIWKTATSASWHTCFNGAALKRARKSGEDDEPSAFSRLLQWSRAQESAEIPGSRDLGTAGGSGFNGAALKRARKLCAEALGTYLGVLLQWSRAQESAEIRKIRNQDGIRGASMEPRSRERGNFSLIIATCSNLPSFNGAALKRARK